jgi:uncharacterized membrane protein YhaH (DUF805 family)
MLRVLLDSRGRAGRVTMAMFFPVSLLLAAAGAAVWYSQFDDLEGAIDDLGWEALAPTLLDPLDHLIATIAIFLLFVLWCAIARAMMTKRLHDRGRSGYWLFLLAAAPVVLAASAFATAPEGPAQFAQGSATAAAIVVILAFLCELFWRKGEADENRYGPNPRRIDPPKGPA